MLAFFRKYEKTFLLLIFAPALLGLGITGTMSGVLGGGGNAEDEVLGTLDGDEVTRGQFERTWRLYRATNPYAQEEDAWRFMALLRAARNAGIAVSDEEVGDRLISDMKWDIAQFKAAKECRDEGIDLTSEDGKRKWQQKFFEKMMTADFDSAAYREVVAQGDHGGLSVQEYEAQARNQELVTRYLDALRAMAVIPTGAVWKEFQEQNHRRKLALLEVDAKTYQPDLAAVGSDAPGLVTDAQIKDFYERNAPDFDSPRRVRFEALAVSLEAAEQSLGAPKDEDLSTYFEAHRAEIAPLTTQSYAELLAEGSIDDDRVRKPLLAEQAREVADRILDQAVSRIATAEVAGEKPDLAAIGSAVREGEGNRLLQTIDTGLIDEAQLSDHALLGGAVPAARWFRVATLGDVSDVLAGPKAWFVLRVAEVKPAISPEFANIIPQVREAYVLGTPGERRRRYEQDKNTHYLQDMRYSFEAVIARDDQMGGDAPHETGKALLEKIIAESRDNVATHKPTWTSNNWPLSRISGLAADDAKLGKLVSKLSYDTAETRYGPLTKAEIEAHPVLGNLAGSVASLEEGMLNSPIETKDGKGWICVRLTHKEAPRPKSFAEAEAQVKDDIRLQRGLERAQVAADALVTTLRGLTGDALAKALADRKLVVKETEPFARDATSLEGIPDAGRLVSQAFSAEAKVDGPFDATVSDATGNRVFVLRVAARVDAPTTAWEGAAPGLRRDLLSKVRGDYATEQTRRTYLASKGITPDHLRYAIVNRDGPGGETQLKLRQLFVAPDRKLIDGWLADQALAKIHQAEAELRQGSSWEAVVDKYSEDEATRTRRGELPPVTRGELGAELGTTFVEAAYSLAEGATSAPIKSSRGYHLVQRQGTRGGKEVFRHLLVRTDATVRKLPADVKDRAWTESRRRIDEALAKLEAGQPFAQVASTYGDIEEPHGQGQDFTVDHVTPFERAALNEVVEWEFPDDAPEAKDAFWLPAPVEVKAADGSSTWQLFCCARSPEDRQYNTSPRHDRVVRHIESKTRGGVDKARERLAAWLKKQWQRDEDRPSFGAIEAEFQKIARDLSEAPDRTKGGTFGLVQLEGDVRAYGDEFLAQLSPDGKPVAAGHRTAVFRGETGWHIVEVVEVVKAGPEREGVIADLLLRSTDWKQ